MIQFLNSSEYGRGFGSWKNGGVSWDDELLVEGSRKHTHVFSREEGSEIWEEVSRLDQSYDSYKLSGRTLIAVDMNKFEVYSMIIANCTPELSIQNSTECTEMSVTFTLSHYGDRDDDSIEVENDCHIGRWVWELTTSEFFHFDSTLIKTLTNVDGDRCGYTDNTICLN